MFLNYLYFQGDDFIACEKSERDSPISGAGSGQGVAVVYPMQTVVEFAFNSGNQISGKGLTVVRMSAEHKRNAFFQKQRSFLGVVIQNNQRAGRDFCKVFCRTAGLFQVGESVERE